MSELHTQLKFMHGNLDAGAVFIERVGGEHGDAELRIRLDLSEHHLLTKLLKNFSNGDQAETQEETTNEDRDAF